MQRTSKPDFSIESGKQIQDIINEIGDVIKQLKAEIAGISDSLEGQCNFSDYIHDQLIGAEIIEAREGLL